MRHGPAQIGPRVRNEGRAPPRLPGCRRRCQDTCKIPLGHLACTIFGHGHCIGTCMTLPHARKQGTRGRPYRVSIRGPPFRPFCAYACAACTCFYACSLHCTCFVLLYSVTEYVFWSVGPARCDGAGRCVRCLWDRRSLESTGVWAHTRILTSLPTILY